MDGTLLYLLDGGNRRVRRLDTSTGIISFIAGSGSSGSANGVGTSASFSFIFYCAVYSSGAVYVSDNGGFIRIVTSSGSVTTLANTVTTPYGIWFDTSGNLFVSSGTASIYRRPVAGGSFELYAGSASSTGYLDGQGTSALFNSPRGLSGDTNGNMFVSDQSNFRVRKIDLATGIVSTYAGSGSSVTSGDGSDALNAGMGLLEDLKFDTTSGVVYAVDFDNDRIRYV